MAEPDIPQDDHPQIQLDLGYDMNHHKRGLALIFNNEKIEKMPSRTGTEKDEERLETTFKKFGFKVKKYPDNNAAQIRDNLIKAKYMDHSNSDCFLCVFLTHGDDGIIYGSDRMPLRLKEEVFDIFRGCESLIGKPKIFIIQACRGQQADTTAQTGGSSENYVMDSGVGVTIPTEADFLTCYSSSKGYYSFRHSRKGSWFIQDLSRVLNEVGNNPDFIQMLTVVNKLVSERTIEGTGNTNLEGAKQMSCFLSTLTRQLHLTEKELLSIACSHSQTERDIVCLCPCNCICQCHKMCFHELTESEIPPVPDLY